MSVQPVVFLVRGFLREEVSPPGAGPGPGFKRLWAIFWVSWALAYRVEGDT